MNDQRIRPGLDEPVEEPAGVLDHQVNFQRKVRDRAQPLDDHRPHAEIGDEVSVHHVDVDAVGPGRGDLADELTEPGEVGGEDGGGNHGE